MKKAHHIISKTLKFNPFLLILFSVLFFVFADPADTGKRFVSQDALSVNEQRIDSLVSAMTLEEKVNMLCGNGLFTSPGVERLDIGELHYTDGPFGIREELGKKSWNPLGLTTDSATFMPTGSALAATWNPDLAYLYGKTLGEEAKTRGKDILLGPAVNITRTPLNGRTYEYMSEDPFLNAKLAVNYVKGVQSCGVASCVKHFAANNQETERGIININMDERTLQEIYLPAFHAAVTEGGALGVMAAYNKFRGSYCAENDYLLNHILKGEWQFRGMVMSDWGGTHSTVGSALHGLDVEMGSSRYFNSNLLDSVHKGLVPVPVINDKVKRILRVILFSHAVPVPVNARVSTTQHMKNAYDIACQSIVLLKNEKDMLPLNQGRIKTLVVIGDNAIRKQAQGGFGAGVKTRYEITPLQGLTDRLGSAVKIRFVQGYKPSYTRGQGMGRKPVVFADRKLVDEAVQAARDADAVVLFTGDNREVETEGSDRSSLTLPFGQDSLIASVCRANPRTILVVVAGAPVDLHMAIAAAPAILWSGFNGSEGGHALADVILGRVNPSGKLPFTFPARLEDSPAHALHTFPGKDHQETYTEGILVGYRWFDTKKIDPMFCFGYGLSYTRFAIGTVKTNRTSYTPTDQIVLTVPVKNTGIKDGYETVQIYVHAPDAKTMRVAEELKAFKKVFIPAKKEAKVSLTLPVTSLARFDDHAMQWVTDPGSYVLSAGFSSRDLLSSVTVTVTAK